MSDSPAMPVPASFFTYWVSTGSLLAGEYPGARNGPDTLLTLRALLNLGVDRFIDLTEVGEYGLPAYNTLAADLAKQFGQYIVYQRLPIRDLSVPSTSRMLQILDAIDDAIAGKHTVYLHCHGGIGRTGTVVGCYLVRHGMPSSEVLAQLAALLCDTLKAGHPIPETREQADFVRALIVK